MIKILDGKLLASNLRYKLSNKINILKNKFNCVPHLIVILVGNNKNSLLYVKNKIRDCKSVGIKCSLLKFPISISEYELIYEINIINKNDLIDGLIVQLPLPNQINKENIISSINPKKDVDGFHPYNFGKLTFKNPFIIPATPLAILKIFDYYKIKTKGKNVVIIGRSHIVGTPIYLLMSRKGTIGGDATITLINSYTVNLSFYTRKADIIIIAIGNPNFLKGYMIKKGVILIDVGINFIKNNIYNFKDYTITGDVDFKSVYKKALYLTPVPGGIGPMTRFMLLKNTFLVFKKKNDVLFKS